MVLAAPLLLALAQAVPEEEVLEGLTYRTVTTVTKANDGGRGRNIVPDTFVLNLNHRFAPSRSVDDAATAFEAWIRSVAPTADIEFTDRSPGARPAADHPLVRALMAAGVSEVAPKQAWTDVARFSARGVAAINFGPGENAQAHQKNESTSLALVDAGYMIIYRWLRSLGGATSAVVEAPRG